MGLADVRKRALQQAKTIEQPQDPVIDLARVRLNLENAYNQLAKLIEVNPHKTHYIDLRIGNRTLQYSTLDAYLKAYKQEAATLGLDQELMIETKTMSSFGDPFYLGKQDDLEVHYIRISERSSYAY